MLRLKRIIAKLKKQQHELKETITMLRQQNVRLALFEHCM